jgi:hypothetical protein
VKQTALSGGRARLGDETPKRVSTRRGHWPTWFGSATIAAAMLSRAQEARVREILGSQPPGTRAAYCLEHLAAATAQIPPAHLADLAAFVRNLRTCGACHTHFGGICGSGEHATPRLLILGRPSPPRQDARRVS